MRRLTTFIRQTFTEDISLIILGIGLFATIFCWTIGIFIWGIELLLLPIMFGIGLLSLSGPIILIVYLIRKNNGGGLQSKNLGRLKSLVFGIYLGFILLNPIYNWDRDQRQKSGLILSESLEIYKKGNGKYPTDLTEIKDELTHLPSAYSWYKFSYHLKSDNNYDLDIPIPIMDRWHWDREKQVFIYSDF